MKTLLKVGLAIAVITMVVMCIDLTHYRFAHPALTETELFLAQWKKILTSIIIAVIAVGLPFCSCYRSEAQKG